MGGKAMAKSAASAISATILLLLLYQQAYAGILSGRIITEDGKSLSKTRITIDGQETMTNEFGGYQVESADGERELKVVIDNVAYTSDKVLIYSPKTEQNWRIDFKGKRLTKIR
jgi:hypothetical protein